MCVCVGGGGGESGLLKSGRGGVRERGGRQKRGTEGAIGERGGE